MVAWFLRSLLNQGLLVKPDGTPLRVLIQVSLRAVQDDVWVPIFCNAAGDILPQVHVIAPRSGDSNAPGFCPLYSETKRVAQARYSVMASLCKDCEENPASSYYGSCRYLHTRRRMYQAQVVIGTHESVLQTPEALDGFDLVIIDEDAIDVFVEKITLTREDIVGLLQSCRRFLPDLPEIVVVLEDFLRLIGLDPEDSSLKRLTSGATPDLKRARHILLHVYREAVPEADARLQRAAEALDDQQRFHQISHQHLAAQGRASEEWTASMRSFRDLICLLAREAAMPVLTDTRAWLSPQKKVKGRAQQMHMELFLPRDEALAVLASKPVLLLDASFYAPLGRYLFGPGLDVWECPVKSHQHITLFIDSLFTEQQLIQDNTAAKWRCTGLSRQLEIIADTYSEPVVVMPKNVLDHQHIAVPDGVTTLYWHGKESRGTNQYRHADVMIPIGHPRVPDYALFQRFSAIRYGQHCQDREATPLTPYARETRWVGVPGYRDEDGLGWERETSYAADREIGDYQQHCYSAEIEQMIARARPTERTAENPLTVLLISGEAPLGMPVDEMTTLAEWLGKQDPAWMAANPVPHGMTGSTGNASCRQNGTNHNRAVYDDKAAYLAAAARQIIADGKKVTQTSLADATKFHSQTVKNHFKRHGGCEAWLEDILAG